MRRRMRMRRKRMRRKKRMRRRKRMRRKRIRKKKRMRRRKRRRRDYLFLYIPPTKRFEPFLISLTTSCASWWNVTSRTGERERHR